MNIIRMKPILRCWTEGAIVIIILCLVLQPAVASDDIESDRFNIALGAFFVARTNGNFAVSEDVGPVNIGTAIDWERDLDGETSLTVPRIDGYYRFTPKHRVDFSWFDIERTGQVVTQRDIDFGNVTFPTGTAVNSAFNTTTVKLAYSYTFYHAPEIETSVSAGLHITDIKMALQSSIGSTNDSESTSAPLPVVGFRLDYRLSQKWWIRSKFELFFLDSVDEFQGSFNDSTLLVEHRTFQHVGFGFGLNRNNIDVNVYGHDRHASMNSLLNGYLLYAVFR